MKNRTVTFLALVVALLISAPAAEAASAAKNQADIHLLLSRWEKAFRAKDVDGVLAVYAPGNEVTAFDIVPPLQVGREAYRKNYEGFFAMYDGPLGFEIRDLKIVADNRVAFLTCLERVTGTLKGGQKSDLWVRITSGLRKIDGKWLIVHDHVSVPVDLATGKGMLELTP